MRSIQKNHKAVVDMNIMICAKDDAELWGYRNMCCTIKDSETYHINLTLTKDLANAFRISQFLQGGVDVFISAGEIEEILFAEIRKKMYDREPLAEFIMGRGEVYMHYYREGKHPKQESCREGSWASFAEDLASIVCRLQEAGATRKSVEEENMTDKEEKKKE